MQQDEKESSKRRELGSVQTEIEQLMENVDDYIPTCFYPSDLTTLVTTLEDDFVQRDTWPKDSFVSRPEHEIS